MEAFAKLEQHKVDLIFLDIEMPLVNGITFLKTLRPFSYERFVRAVAYGFIYPDA